MYRRTLLAAALSIATAASASAQTEGNFGSIAIGLSAQSTVTLTFPSAATVGSISVVTQGAPALDYTNLNTGTCKAGTTYAAGQTCTVAINFKPAYAGQRLGQVLLEDDSNNVLANAYLSGTGTGPQIAYGPGVAIAIAPTVNGKTLIQPSGVAVDGFGTLYIADDNNDRVVILPANGAAASAIDPIVAGSGFRTPRGVAVDAAGNLYISDLDSNRVMEVPANGGPVTATDPNVNNMGLHYPCGLVIDPSGNLFIADVDNGRVLEVPANGGSVIALDPKVNGIPLNYPVTLAMDSAGDLYIADLFNNQVVEMPANGGPAVAIDPIVDGKGLDQPYGVAVDAAGDLIIADSGNNRMVEVPGNGAPAFAFVPTVDGKAINDPIGIALDPGGNLFIADSNNNRVVEVQRSQPPTVSFVGTAVGTASGDSPQTAQLLNIGNEPLSLAIPTSGNNPAITANFTLSSGATSDCPSLTPSSSAAGTLAAGASCNLPISFVPTTTGSLTGSLTLQDNNLNALAATQTIPLVGDSPVSTLSTQTLSFGPQQIGSPSAAQQITLTNSGGAALAITSIALSGTNAGSFASTNTCGATVAAAASCTIQVVFSPSAAGPLTATLAIADNAAVSPQSVVLNGTGVYLPTVTVAPTSSSVTTAQTLAVSIAVANATTAQIPSGTVTLTSGAYTSASTTLSAGAATITIPAGSLAVGTDTLQAAYAPDEASASVYLANTGTAQVTVTAGVVITTSAPAVATGQPSAVTDQSATLAGTVNPNGADTHVWFLYGTSGNLAGAAQTPAQDLGSGSTITAATANLTGLSPTTLYYYQLVAQNSVGTTKGAIDSFTTIGAPYITLNGTALTVAPGASTGNTSTIDIVPWNGFTGAVALTCQVTTALTSPTDLPTCSLSPASVTITGANSVQSTLTVGTVAPVASNRAPFLWPSAGGAILACLLLFISPSNLRRRTPLLILFLLCLSSAGVGCSGSGNSGGGGTPPPPASPGTTPGAYTITVSGTSGSSTITTSFALTVQ